MTGSEQVLDGWTVAPPGEADHAADLSLDLARRRNALREAESRHGRLPAQRADGGAIGVPVLAVLAPVVTSTEGVIEYPGDPMCLYAALRDNVAQSVLALHSHWEERNPLRDVVLDWAAYPGSGYRELTDDSGIRTPLHRRAVVSDELVFDPRVWNGITERAFRQVLQAVRPAVLLISSVSAAHRYALRIAQVAREEIAGIYIILGGRHADETMTWSPTLGQISLDFSSTVRVLHERRADVQVNAVVSGDGSPLLDTLATAVLLAGDGKIGSPSQHAIAAKLRQLRDSGHEVHARGLIVLAAEPGKTMAFPFSPSRLGPSRNAPPSPYKAFAIRSRFTVFSSATAIPRRTAHYTTAPTCPFRCTFCSESSAVADHSSRLTQENVSAVVGGLADLAAYGAEAVFCDDPVLWSGNWSTIEAFAELLSEVRALPAEEARRWHSSLGSAAARRRWRNLVWGGQLTIDLLLDKHRPPRVPRILGKMKAAGCAYIYIGIESMSDGVMVHVNKNLLRRDGRPWPVKVREALAITKQAAIPVGSSVLFGLDGETEETIEETIEEIGRLIDESLITLASPNILTYHPGTVITRQHGQNTLDYHSPVKSTPPYIFFEEAYPGVVSRNLTIDQIWQIHLRAQARWGNKRNSAGLTTMTNTSQS